MSCYPYDRRVWRPSIVLQVLRNAAIGKSTGGPNLELIHGWHSVPATPTPGGNWQSKGIASYRQIIGRFPLFGRYKFRDNQPDKARKEILRHTQKKAYDVLKNPQMRLRIVVAESRMWRWLERVGLVVVGFAAFMSVAGILTTAKDPGVSHAVPEAPASIPVHPTESRPVEPVPVPAVRVPAPNTSTVKTRPPEAEVKNGTWLRAKGSVVVVANSEAAASELLQHPEKLADLIQSGSLFSVPNDTPVEIVETRDGLSQVHILGPVFEGRGGWVRSDRVFGKGPQLSADRSGAR